MYLSLSEGVYAMVGLIAGLAADGCSVRLLVRRGLKRSRDRRLSILLCVGGACALTPIATWLSPAEQCWAIVIGFLLLSLVASDFQAHLLPNGLLLALVSVLLLRAWGMERLAVCTLGALAGLVVMLVLVLLMAVVTKTWAIGAGDIKLAMALGLLVGWPGVISALNWGMLMGAIVFAPLLLLRLTERHATIAYGPYLAMGAWLFWLLSQR